ncbi:DUF4407 domain-containing protein [Bradyrhizobium diazoefficiens]|uniref:DUF4407 domain-containing protein n=1 Tax=Bradyrhizobium diazoefficiens TaxID=1355477 RepID=UPI00190B74C7|nr:DUF4407 domain-containing protein [Bradyrhizobium diazoefficiens]MBK3666268.1 DUF4407 domain-containing protein [Bradyrhizobium diazoefficiens]
MRVTTEQGGRSDQEPGSVGASALCGTTRILWTLAGVDPDLAARMPRDEQWCFRRVALAMLIGGAFQLSISFTAMSVLTDQKLLALGVALLISLILFSFDLAFVHADWISQGLSTPGLQTWSGYAARIHRVKRGLSLGSRWLLSIIAASLFAQCLLFVLFRPEIDSYLAREHAEANALVVQAAWQEHAKLLTALNERVVVGERREQELGAERSLLPRAGQESGITKELAHQDHVRSSLEQEIENMERALDHQRTSAAAEQFGVKLSTSTGLRGQGDYYQFHQLQAQQTAQALHIKRTALEELARKIETLRMEQMRQGSTVITATDARLAALDQALDLQRKATDESRRERQVFEAQRQPWIEEHARNDFNYVPPRSGLLADLDALLAISKLSPALAAFVLLLKAMIMALELAGPLTKALLTPPSTYATAVALRFLDCLHSETERRRELEHDRAVATDRRETVAHAIEMARSRRRAETQASSGFHKLFDDAARATA